MQLLTAPDESGLNLQGLPEETVVEILAALPYTEISINVVRVCRKWHELRSSEHFRATRAVVDERGLVVVGGFDSNEGSSSDDGGTAVLLCRALVGGRWRERASLPHVFTRNSTSFCGELVLLGLEWRESAPTTCCRAFNLEANAWRTLQWHNDQFVQACCGTDAVVIAFSRAEVEGCHLGPARLRSLRPGSTEGWVSIPDPPLNVLRFFNGLSQPSFCCVDDVLYIVGGAESGETSDAPLQAFDLSRRSWAVCAPLPEPRSYSACVQLAGRLYVIGGLGGGDGGGGEYHGNADGEYLASVFSYDPRADQWRSESPLPLRDYGADSPPVGLGVVAHEGRVVVIGIAAAPPLALVGDVWIELPPLPPRPGSSDAAGITRCAHVASLHLG